MADEIILLYIVNTATLDVWIGMCAVFAHASRLHSYLHTLEDVKLWFMQNTLHSTQLCGPESIFYFVVFFLLA